MWDGLFTLLFLCILMGGASFAAGALPLSFSLSSRQLRLLTALGTGVLVGTSLIVIIPEGIETLYSAGGGEHGHHERSLGRQATSVRREWGGDLPRAGHAGEAVIRRADEGVAIDPDIGFVTGPDDGRDSAEDAVKHASPSTDPTSETPHPAPSHDDHKESSHREPHAWVGLSLISGFILMYLIDTLPRHATRPSRPKRFSISLNSFSFHQQTASEIDDTADPDSPSTHHDSSTATRPSSTTVGLVIHAAADGIALGASSTTTPRLSFIIFLALMIHKAPAAFGLTTTLLKQGLSKRSARFHLIIFALAAPVGALLTWSAAHLFGFAAADDDDQSGKEFGVGVLLLFSAGTFLYVAMHTMQEGGHAQEAANGNGYAGVPAVEEIYGARPGQRRKEEEEEGAGKGLVETLVTVGGMLLPLLTELGGHGH